MIRPKHTPVPDENTKKATKIAEQFQGTHGTTTVDGITYEFTALRYMEGPYTKYACDVKASNGKSANTRGSSALQGFTECVKQILF